MGSRQSTSAAERVSTRLRGRLQRNVSPAELNNASSTDEDFDLDVECAEEEGTTSCEDDMEVESEDEDEEEDSDLDVVDEALTSDRVQQIVNIVLQHGETLLVDGEEVVVPTGAILPAIYQRAARGRGRQDDTRAGYQRLRSQQSIAPLEDDFGQLIDSHTSAVNLRQPALPVDAQCACSKGGAKVLNALTLLKQREGNQTGSNGGFTRAQQCHLAAFTYLPNQPVKIQERMNSRAYIGQFSQDGSIFVAAFQHERRVRLYDVENDWRLSKDVHARNLRWTVTDTHLSPDQRFLLYASISPTVNMVNVNSTGEVVSEANVTDIHEALHFGSVRDEGEEDNWHSDAGFGIWSLRWSGDGREIVAGTSDHCLYIYDVERQKTTTRIRAHRDDINAVGFLDETSNVIVSGSDDTLIKVWDKRCGGSRAEGVLVGHTEGITHIDPQGDGRHLLSNCKDQTAKLWDIRRMISQDAFTRLAKPRSFSWDYRWMEYPGSGYDVRHPHDASIMTYRGHAVLKTLIRAYFSPMHSTGQRYIYTGSADGSVYIYDAVTGRVAEELRYHREIVRDCSWHPWHPLLATTSFDGTLATWEHRAQRAPALPDPRHDQDPYY